MSDMNQILLMDLHNTEGTKYEVGIIYYVPFDKINGYKHSDGTVYTEDEIKQAGISLGVLVPKPLPIENPPDGYAKLRTIVDTSTTPPTVSYEYSPITSTDAPVQNPSTLDDYKKNKLYEIEQAYEKEAYGVFTSTAFDGKTEETYSCSQTDQVRINGEVTMAMAVKAGFSTEPISWKNVNQVQCVAWTADSMIKLGTDLHAFVTAKTDYLEALTMYINSLTTIDDVQKVTWGMTIPTTTTA